MKFPDKKYDIIYADPPWTKQFGFSQRSYEHHYPTMPDAEILALPVDSIAEKNSVLYLWTTPIHLKRSLDIMEGWGFIYKTNVVWDKQIIGCGMWFRNQHEQLLLGTKGYGLAPEKGTQFSSVFSVRRGSHSVKPYQIREMIEKYHPDASKIELFARPNILDYDRGWDFWGNEVDKSDE